MKKILVLLLLSTATVLYADVEVDFDYKAMSGFASNQFALWVENADSEVVKTLFVTDFTGVKRGYKKREQSLNNWVAVAKPVQMSDAEIDAISGATPKSGVQHFVWDLTDKAGKKVPAGKYFIKLEGTLYQGSNAVYTGAIDTGKTVPGPIEVVLERSEPATTKNETMLQNVKMSMK
jgi:hypothetical protein